MDLFGMLKMNPFYLRVIMITILFWSWRVSDVPHQSLQVVLDKAFCCSLYNITTSLCPLKTLWLGNLKRSVVFESVGLVGRLKDYYFWQRKLPKIDKTFTWGCIVFKLINIIKISRAIRTEWVEREWVLMIHKNQISLIRKEVRNRSTLWA